jgi:putative proteasome-type protease
MIGFQAERENRMTYCVALKISAGLVMLADTRTNAGVDNISRYRKSFTWEVPGERAICLMTAGNLSITQGIVTRIDAAIQKANQGASIETVLNADTLFRATQIVAEHMREMQDRHRISLMNQGVGADATVMVAGQRKGGAHRLFMIYSAGNFIEATPDTPFFQIGEHKYGKPILDRVITPDTPMSEALKAVCVSMDSTLRSNLSVGMPLDLVVIPADSCAISINRRIEQEDPDWQAISSGWSHALRLGFQSLPAVTL